MHKLHLILQRLVEAKVEFVVIGGYAAVIHGSAYVTNDVDVCTVLSPENVERIRAALVDLKRCIGRRIGVCRFWSIPRSGRRSKIYTSKLTTA
jgi:hypothetical protein